MFTSDDDTLVLASVSLEDPYMDGFDAIAHAADAELEDILMSALEDEVRSFVELYA